MLEVGGFDESMIYGWHVDSNFAKRIWLETGDVRSMTEFMSIYHCNHNRVLTQYQTDNALANDPTKYVHEVKFGEHRLVSNDWGLEDFGVEKVSLKDLLARKRGVVTKLTNFEAHALPTLRIVSGFCLEDAHAGLSVSETFPFVLDALLAFDEPPNVLYLGVRENLVARLANLSEDGIISSVARTLKSGHSATTIDLAIVDLTPSAPTDCGPLGEEVRFAPEDAEGLLATLATLRRISQEGRSNASIDETTRWLFINSEGNLFEGMISAGFHLVPSQLYSRVRMGIRKTSGFGSSQRLNRVLGNLLDRLAETSIQQRSGAHGSSIVGAPDVVAVRDRFWSWSRTVCRPIVRMMGVLRRSLNRGVQVPTCLPTYVAEGPRRGPSMEPVRDLEN